MHNTWLLLGLSVFTAAWLIPGHFPPWAAFQQQWASALGVAFVVLAASTRRSEHDWRWPLPALLILGVAAVPVLQHLAGQVVFVSDAVLPALYIAAFALSIAAGANLTRANGHDWIDAWM